MTGRNGKAEMERRDLERFQYWQGQQLRNRDFHDLAQIEDQLRWWHNRSLHEIPGVREGFEVQMGIDALIIGCGLAYDGSGRELIHTQETIIFLWTMDGPLPAEGLFLFVQAASSQQGKRSLRGACIPAQVERSRKQVEFVWIKANEIGAQNGVRLGRLYRGTDGEPHFDPGRRFSRALARPRIVSGSTIPGATDWDVWEQEGSLTLFGLQVHIDTSSAEFTRIPCYFAWLQAADWLAINAEDKKERLGLNDWLSVEHIDEVSALGFTFCLMPLFLFNSPGRLTPDSNDILLRFIQKVKPFVCWIGIEPGLADVPVRREISNDNI